MMKITAKFSRGWHPLATFCIIACCSTSSYCSTLQNIANKDYSDDLKVHSVEEANSSAILDKSTTDANLCWKRALQACISEGSKTEVYSSTTESLNELYQENKGNVALQDWIRLPGDLPIHLCFKNCSNFKKRVVKDIFWLTSNEDFVVYIGNSSDVVMTWDYLSVGQKALEFMITWLIAGVTVATIVGNGLVMTVRIGSSDKYDHWWMVRTSLAITDILRGAFLMTYALNSIMSLVNCDLQYLVSAEPIQSDWYPINVYEPLFRRNGYSVFCGYLFRVTEVMSLQCQGWFAIERLLLSKFDRTDDFLSLRKVRIVNCFMWLVGIAFPLVVLIAENELGTLEAAFDPATKIPFLLPTGSEVGLSHVAYWILEIYLLFLFLVTVFASVKSLVTFKARCGKEIAESTIEQQEKDNDHIITTMKLMFALYLVSTTPRVLLALPGIKQVTRPIYFLCWWVFISSSSWNWYVFNFRSRLFCTSFARVLLRSPWLPNVFRGELEKLSSPTSASNLEWGSVWHELEAEIEKKKVGTSEEEAI